MRLRGFLGEIGIIGLVLASMGSALAQEAPLPPIPESAEVQNTPPSDQEIQLIERKTPLARTIVIKEVELKRIGKQLNVRVLADGPPTYEIHANLEKRTLLVRFKNAQLGWKDSKNERLFNDALLEGVRFFPENGELWAQFKTTDPNLTYSLNPKAKPEILEIELRQKRSIQAIPVPPKPPSIELLGVRFVQQPPSLSRVTLMFSKKPEILVAQDEVKKLITLRLGDTHPAASLQIKPYEDERLRFGEISQDANQTFLTIQSKLESAQIQQQFEENPPRWILDISLDPVAAEIAAKKALENETPEQRKARVEKRRRDTALQRRYNTAEELWGRGELQPALNAFKSVYNEGRTNEADFQDPLHPLAIQAMFRVADVMFKILEKKKASNYHEAIAAYETALRIAQDHKLESDLLPHAYFQVGKAYQNMKFHYEANRTYRQLQLAYPDSPEAAEANFWAASVQVDRREWQAAIDDFREYLRAPGNPTHLAAAHYKMAEAYYNLKNYAKAKEGFDRGRAIDLKYPENDPTLLFRMGETYYESGDFATAREVFSVLLQKYPTADFSKLVALRLGDFLRDEGKTEEAIEVYKNAVTSFSQEIALLGQMRIANVQAQRPHTDDYKKALKVYEMILTQHGESPLVEEAMLRKGLTLTLFGLYPEAIAALEGFAQKYPQNNYTQRGLIQENIDENLKSWIDQRFQTEDYLGVVGIYRDHKTKYLAKFRFDTTLFQVAYAYQKLGLFDESIDLYKFFSERGSSPLKELGNFQQAHAFNEKQDYPQAREALLKFIPEYQAGRYDADAKQLLAGIYRQSREYQEAIKVYEQAIQQYAQDKDPLRAEVVPEFYYGLANIYSELGQYVEAGNAYENAVKMYFHPLVGKIGPEVPAYIALSHFLKGEMLFKAKRDPEALAAFEKALELYRQNEDPEIQERVAWANYQIGLIYQRTGKEQEALKLFKQLMENPKGDGKLWKKLAGDSFTALSKQIEYNNYLKL